MKEYRGIIKNIIVNDNSVDSKITFIVKVGFRMLSITMDNSINSIFNINDEVIVVEDKVLGNKTYNIYHKGDDYND